MKSMASPSKRQAVIVGLVVIAVLGSLIYEGSRVPRETAEQRAAAAEAEKRERVQKAVDDAISRIPRTPESTPESNVAVPIPNESRANPRDVRQAKEFLASLPLACMQSRIAAAVDGTVRIQIACRDASKSMDGTVEIKNGIVTNMR